MVANETAEAARADERDRCQAILDCWKNNFEALGEEGVGLWLCIWNRIGNPEHDPRKADFMEDRLMP